MAYFLFPTIHLLPVMHEIILFYFPELSFPGFYHLTEKENMFQFYFTLHRDTTDLKDAQYLKVK